LTLASATAGTASAAATNAPTAQQTNGGSIGDCTTDTFNIISNGKPSPPQICGSNSGQHMIVDASDQCHTVNIDLGASDTSTSRSWTIVVSQYTCGEENLAGPMGCLQWHTGTSGRIANFGIATSTTAAAFTAAQTHLSNQDYNICVRRENGYCYICYIQAVAPAIADSITAQNTFGLSISSAAGSSKAIQGTSCTTDYVTIPGGQVIANAIAAINVINAGTFSKFCGRGLNTGVIVGSTAVSICSTNIPFTVGVYYDADETTATGKEDTNEQVGGPAGISGFDLNFVQGKTNC